ncbi:uncharacterized protein HMPREF1541_06996 [Cyphellophora europaea CBS 101466]|uniref:Protein kinase domain-containing protein n=1 Tax=Cyphellophora europaea (strain CBS 101466) TaxID=1220924 RepID=W2RTC3_CYPE1|nr:uncharacterized protein HMPREF1541_06996 [Cyphellophora europaea CBS 101466]ETN38954.1 hypothetical protein HMPREF1541_06996 [Cyphellophora europaea CBS 101466]
MSLTRQSIVLARKTFFGGEAEARNNYLNEVRFDEFLRGTLNSSEEIHENIMTAFCGYGNMVDSKATWSIFYHRAQCSLTEYLANDNYFPITSRGRLEHIYQMLCIANALKWMADRTHDGVQGPVELGYYHCDLKPSNILVFITEGDPSKLTFKVSDFGRAVPSSNASGPGRSMNRSSTVPVEAIDSMCSAPEMSGKIPVVGSRSDVWSFGCILLLVLVFNAHGMAAVAEFTSSLLRTAATDSFWEPRHKSFGRTADIVVKAEVSNCIEQLRNLTRDNTDWVVVDGLLTLLEKEILITNRKKRARLDRLIAQMAERYNSRYQVTPKEEKRNRQAQYLLCAQSPRGEFELFHEKGDRRTLFIWRFGWTGPLHELRPMSPPKDSENILPQLNPHSDSCASEKICQVVSNRDPFEVGLVEQGCIH